MLDIIRFMTIWSIAAFGVLYIGVMLLHVMQLIVGAIMKMPRQR